ncbi:PTS sugar transporter subunit IIB [Dolosigranulum savutiense]|uniref:PTS sugar transporter subunit IIB n=1 Tax=Dolosigranulum savutiense TaxID=3110288 RepID=A0AB74TRN2_9LACT
MLKVVTVCGMGVGTSLIMKMTVEKALERIDVKANVEHWDMGTVESQSADLIVTTRDFEKNFKDREDVVFLDNPVDEESAEEKLRIYFEERE